MRKRWFPQRSHNTFCWTGCACTSQSYATSSKLDEAVSIQYVAPIHTYFPTAWPVLTPSSLQNHAMPTLSMQPRTVATYIHMTRRFPAKNRSLLVPETKCVWQQKKKKKQNIDTMHQSTTRPWPQNDRWKSMTHGKTNDFGWWEKHKRKAKGFASDSCLCTHKSMEQLLDSFSPSNHCLANHQRILQLIYQYSLILWGCSTICLSN